MRNLILQLEDVVLRSFIDRGCHENSHGYDLWATSSRVFAPEDREVAKAVMRNLVAKGEAAVVRGLVNEDDGMLMGSGWYITRKGLDRVKNADPAMPPSDRAEQRALEGDAATATIRALADENARLRAENERLRANMSSGSFYQEKDIDAMQDEIERLRAERDAAWQAGAEAMREAAANGVAVRGAIVDHPSVFMGGPSRNAIRIAGAFADAIRALPLPGQPKEVS